MDIHRNSSNKDLERFKTARNYKFKQTNFFDRIDGKEMIITVEIRVPYVEYEGYQIGSVEDLVEYEDHLFYWFSDHAEVKEIRFE